MSRVLARVDGPGPAVESEGGRTRGLEVSGEEKALSGLKLDAKSLSSVKFGRKEGISGAEPSVDQWIVGRSGEVV